MSSFGGKHMHLFLRKHADRLSEDVLEAEEGEPGGHCTPRWRHAGTLQPASLAACRACGHWAAPTCFLCYVPQALTASLALLCRHCCVGCAGKGSLWSKVTSWAGSGGGGVPAPEGEGERETIHVFTVASGHM